MQIGSQTDRQTGRTFNTFKFRFMFIFNGCFGMLRITTFAGLFSNEIPTGSVSSSLNRCMIGTAVSGQEIILISLLVSAMI
jgi:hypothetical protein